VSTVDTHAFDAALRVERESAAAAARRRRLAVVGLQLAILVAGLVGWEYLPKVGFLHAHFTFLDPFFISSPSGVYHKLSDLFAGANGSPSIWPFARNTVQSSLLGTVIGTFLGGFVGLVLSTKKFLSDVLRPYIIALNAIPRIALIPVIVILFGPTPKAATFTAITIVFFVVFFNAYEGGRTVPPHVVQNARVLGASDIQLMRRVRLQYVVAWTITALPNAVSFALISVVTAEILTGSIGMGRLLLDSVTTVQSSLTFAVVVVLSVLGIVFVAITEGLRRKLLHWWVEGE
jgi:NitT/TauT family transport system permease protein